MRTEGRPPRRPRIRCKDCRAEGVTSVRPTPHRGPRCTPHHYVERKRRRLAASVRHVEKNFELSQEDYDLIYESQGGRCFGCRYATGRGGKRLAVDHQHDHPGCEHPPERGCPRCIRALLCGQCNQILGRYDVEALKRLIEVLEDPPARRVLATLMKEAR